jgi:hypothetical protein
MAPSLSSLSLYRDNIVVFRHTEPNALRKICAFLRWQIMGDNSGSDTAALKSHGNLRIPRTYRYGLWNAARGALPKVPLSRACISFPVLNEG